MATGFSRAEFMEFLDFMGKKGLGGASMVAGRRAAANALFSVLTDEEASDVRTLNLDRVAQRFMNLRGTDFKPSSIQIYKSRIERAIEDLVRYRQDPIAFKPVGGGLRKSTSSKNERPPAAEQAQASVNSPMSSDTAQVAEITFPIPIRPGVVVRIIGIPNDLSRKEAERVSNVILALATDSGAQ